LTFQPPYDTIGLILSPMMGLLLKSFHIVRSRRFLMQKFLFSPKALPNVSIGIFDQSGRIITPDEGNGFLGVFRHGTKIALHLSVKGEHTCFTLNPQGLQKIPKAKNELGGYTKNFTIDCSTGTGQIARWPANMVCLEVPGNTYNIGIANQNGRFFFVVEDSPSPENLPEGMVVSFSLLRGVGTVAFKPGFDARLHWKAVPFNHHLGLRIMQTGDLLEWEKSDLVDLGGETTFRYEIKKCTNLSLPH